MEPSPEPTTFSLSEASLGCCSAKKRYGPVNAIPLIKTRGLTLNYIIKTTYTNKTFNFASVKSQAI